MLTSIEMASKTLCGWALVAHKGSRWASLDRLQRWQRGFLNSDLLQPTRRLRISFIGSGWRFQSRWFRRLCGQGRWLPRRLALQRLKHIHSLNSSTRSCGDHSNVLSVADFDGDGRADVVTASGRSSERSYSLLVTYLGRGDVPSLNWHPYPSIKPTLIFTYRAGQMSAM